MNNDFKNRDKYLGGSDFPALMGDSPFTKPFEVLLEKAGLQPKVVEDNLYISFGNILEPYVQKAMKTINMDEETFSSEAFAYPVKCHIDGKRGKTLLIEIKCSGKSLKEVYKQYKSQIQVYMHVCGLKKAELHLYGRKNFQETFDGLKEKFEMDFRCVYSNDEEKEEAEKIIKEDIESGKIEISKDKIEVLKIEYDQDLQNEIERRVEILNKYVDIVKYDPFFEDEEQLKVDFENELNAKSNEIALINNEAISEMKNILIQMDSLKTREKELKQELKQEMENNNIKKIDNDEFQIIITEPTTRKSMNKDLIVKFLGENGFPEETIEDFMKESKVAGAIKIKLK